MSDKLEIGNYYKIIVAPTIGKLQLAAAIDQSVTFDSEGCRQLANILQTLAEKMDVADALFKALEEDKP